MTRSGRTKEESEDYRYFQDPDLLPLYIDAAWRERVAARRPDLPAAKRKRYIDLGADLRTAELLVDAGDLAALFEESVAGGADPRNVGIWLTGEVVRYLRSEDVEIADTGLTAASLVDLAAMIDDGDLSATAAKDVLAAVLTGDGGPREVAESRDLLQISDASAIEAALTAEVQGPRAVLLRSVKGKGVSFMEGKLEWHYRPLDDELYARAVAELERA